MKPLISRVPGHVGECKPVWLNFNYWHNRQSDGVTGFFRLVRSVWWWPWPVMNGPEFHGVIRNYEVFTTEESK